MATIQTTLARSTSRRSTLNRRRTIAGLLFVLPAVLFTLGMFIFPLLMTFWMSLDWPLLVGGKPIATVPPYVVFMFELMVLIGALSTVAGVIILSLRNPTTGLAYDGSFSDDRIGIFIPCAAGEVPGLERMLKEAGSVEVRHAA